MNTAMGVMRITHSLVPRRKSLARLTAGGLFIINGLGPIKEASLRILTVGLRYLRDIRR